jgi:spermidine/putrescine transport system substrate-binding protein
VEAAARVSFANWPGYIDRDPADPGLHPTLAGFTRRTGIAVDYSEPITGNEQFFSSIGIPMAMRRSPGYDLVVLSDWLVGQFIGLGWARKLDPQAVPNSVRLLPALRESPLAEVLGYSLPWQGGLTGIGYNLAATGRPIRGMRDLLTSPDLRGRVSLVMDMRDDIGLILLDQGHDPARFSDAEFDLALETLNRAVQSGQIRTVTNSYRDALVRGDIAACVAWAGDLLDLRRQHPGLRFTLPEAGGLLWTDNMMILDPAPHPREAERLMDYYYEPEVAARLAVSQLFICPVAGAGACTGQAGATLPGREYVFPPPEALTSAHYFKRLTPVQNSAMTEQFSSVIGR